MRLCSSLPANRSVCARRARGEEVCRSRWTEHPPGGDFHLAISGDFEMAIDNQGQQRLVDVLEDGACSGFEQSDVRRRLVWTIGRFKVRTNGPSTDARQHGYDKGPATGDQAGLATRPETR